MNTKASIVHQVINTEGSPRHNQGMTYLLNVQHLDKSFGDNKVVDDLSFHISPGECLGVIGPNGAGKTTTLRMCLGLTTPDAGSITYFDSLSMPDQALAIKARLGVVAQMDTLDPDFTAEENLSMAATSA